MQHSWSDRPDAAQEIRSLAAHERRLEAFALLGEKGGPAFADEVLASLRADIERVKGQR